MSKTLALPGPLGFVASEQSLCSELDVAAAHCAAEGLVLAVSSAAAVRECTRLRAAHRRLRMITDTCFWSTHVASADEPSAVSGQLLDLDSWAQVTLSVSGAESVLAPSGYIRLGDTAALEAVLAEFSQVGHPGLVPFLAVDAATLNPRHLPGFIDAVKRVPLDRLAFLFAGKPKTMANYARLKGLRDLLKHFPGSQVHGVDVLTGTDAVAHGAGWVGIGASSGRRWPRRPGDPGGGPLAEGYVPGTFLRELLEMRSPVIYGDWYANSPSPFCARCARSLDSYRATAADKALVIEHNMHAIDDFARELTDQPAYTQAAWLNEARIEAFTRHSQLTSTAAAVNADLALRRLCELDDPQMRETTPAGGWA